jgi:hypothetical protein
LGKVYRISKTLRKGGIYANPSRTGFAVVHIKVHHYFIRGVLIETNAFDVFHVVDAARNDARQKEKKEQKPH